MADVIDIINRLRMGSIANAFIDYTLNDIVHLDDEDKEIVTAIINVLKDYPEITYAFIYGSFARHILGVDRGLIPEFTRYAFVKGVFRPESDVDIMIYANIPDIHDIMISLENRLGNVRGHEIAWDCIISNSVRLIPWKVWIIREGIWVEGTEKFMYCLVYSHHV